MPVVHVREEESFENALRRFKRKVEKSGILTELRKRQHFEKPSVKRKRKAVQARKKIMRKLLEERRQGLAKTSTSPAHRPSGRKPKGSSRFVFGRNRGRAASVRRRRVPSGQERGGRRAEPGKRRRPRAILFCHSSLALRLGPASSLRFRELAVDRGHLAALRKPPAGPRPGELVASTLA